MVNARAFLQKVESTPDLQNKLNAARWDMSEMLKLAAAAGFNTNAAELQAAIDERWGDLSEDELRRVAGGKHDTDYRVGHD